MKYFIILSFAVIVGCSSEKKSNNIKVEINKALNVKMTFERLSEYEINPEKKAKLKALFSTLNIDSNPEFIGWEITSAQQPILHSFIETNQEQLLLDNRHEFKWLKKNNKRFLFQINQRETIDISTAITSASIEQKSISLQLSPKGVTALRSFVMHNINQTLLVELNDKVVSAVVALGDFKDETLTIENIDTSLLNDTQE